MSNKITLATIQFRADTKGVNPALDAMRQSAKDAHKEVDELEKAFANGIKTMKDANGVEFNVADRLRAARKEAKSFDQGVRELIKGATALEAVVKNIQEGIIEASSRAELKGAINGAQSRLRPIREKLENGTINEEDLQRQRELNTVILESQKQLNRLDHDTAKVIETIQQGGSISQSVLDQEQKGLRDMLTLIPKGTEEWNKYNAQLQTIEAHVESIRKQEQQAATSLLSSRNLGQYSEEQIRTAISSARELLTTYKTASPEAKALADNIVRAEQYLKDYGIEAARVAQREAAAIKTQEEAEKQLQTTMNKRLQSLKILSADALAETRKYWEARRNGAEQGTAAYNKAEAALKRIDNLQKNRRVAELDNILGDPSKHGIAEVRNAVQEMEKLRDSVQQGIPAWQHYNKMVEQGKAYLDNLAKSEAAERINQQMQGLSTLSATGLQEVKRYWETMAAGAAHGSTELDQYRAKLEQVMAEEKARSVAQAQQRVGILGGNLGSYSEAEIRQAIEAGKELIQTYKTADPAAQQLAKNIVSAEEHLKQYGVEAERTAVKETEAIRKAADERRKNDALMEAQLSNGTSLTQEALKAQEQYWQRLINDPKTASGSLAQYQANLDRVRATQQQMMQQRGQDALNFFRGDTRNASADQIKQQADAMKKYRDSLPQKDNAAVSAEIDGYLQQVAATTQKATEQTMTWKQAMQVSAQAGTGSFKGTTEQLNQAKKTLEDMSAKAVKGGLAWRRMQEALQRIELELKNVGQLSAEVQAVLDQPKGKSFNALKQAVEQGRLALNAMDRSTEEGQKRFEELAAKIKAADFEMKQLGNSSKGTASAFDKAWSRLKTYVSLYVGAAVAMQKLTAAMGDLLTLSDKMGEVRKTTGFTADEVGRLSNNLAKLDTRTSLTQLMELSSLAGSVGLKTQEQVQGFTEAADQLIVALPELGNESARTIIKIANATGDLEKNGGNVRETLEKVGSTIIALRANSASAAGPITDFVSRVGAVGAQAGISIDQIAALGSTIDALGGRVEMSATALSRMIPAIKNNSFAIANSIGVTEKYLKSLAPMEQMVLIFQKMRDSIQHIDTSTEQGQEQMAQTIEGMLGRNATMREVMKDLEQQGARAGIVFGLLSQNVDELEKQLGIASEAYRENTALANEFANMNETAAAKWERLKNQVEEAFVGDNAQRSLGWIIDRLRELVDLITENGPIGRGLRLLIVSWSVFKIGVGDGVSRMVKGLKNLEDRIAETSFSLKGLVAGWKSMEAATRANIIGAAAAGVLMLVKAISDWYEAQKRLIKAVAETDQQIYNEMYTINKMFDSVTKANTAVVEHRNRVIDLRREVNNLKEKVEQLTQSNDGSIESTQALGSATEKLKEKEAELKKEEEALTTANNDHAASIREINNKYGEYLGFIISETSSLSALANARELVNAKLRETINLKGKEAGLTEVEERNASKNRKANERLSSSLETAYDVFSEWGYQFSDEEKADIRVALEELVTETLDKSRNEEFGNRASALIFSRFRGKDANNKAEVDDSGFTYLNAYEARVLEFLSNYRKQLMKVEDERKEVERIYDARGTVYRGKTQAELTEQFDETEKTIQTKISQLADADKEQRKKLSAEILEQYDQYKKMVDASSSYFKLDDEKENEAFLELKKNREARLDEYEKQREQLLKEAGDAYKPIQNGNGGGGGPYHNGSNSPTPYGSYNRITSPYQDWDADTLVSRRKEMLERVRALANGADVQAVLSEDAKFITEATRKNIKDTKQAIEWYNTERLKIQDALHEKHLTNTGDWMDPTKQKARAKVIKDEWSAYLNELDAYYTERKTRIQEAATEEGITEAEMKNRTLANEMEWYQRRAELQKLYAKKSTEVTEEEQQAIFDILSERTGDTADFIQKTIGKTVKFIYDIGQKSEAEQRTIFGKLDKGIERDLLKQQQAVTAQMKAIRDIIEKERPYDGITRNLRENLVTMGILTADMTAERNRLMRENADMSDFNSRQATEEMKRTAFMLGEAENAYSTTIEEVMRHMGEQGMQAWADAIRGDTQMQQALMAQLRTAYDEIQNAIKKEASLIKKQTDIWWADIAEGQTQSRRDGFEKALSRLGLAEDQVKRANSLIGAGQASERVADRLAIKQMQVRLAMQTTYYNRMRQIGEERIAQLKAEGRLEDAEHLRRSLNLAKTEELKKLEEQRVAIANQMEESQNRLYTALREWGDLVASSLQGVFEASNTGQKEFYTEQAKKRLTGASTSGQYIVVENAGTKDAEASYQTLSDQEVLDIEQRNAMADAWKKLMDDLNMKMSETITDQLNAMVQNVSIDANTDALDANTKAILRLAATMAGGGAGDDSAAGAGFGVDGISPLQPTSDTPAAETIISPWQAYAEGSTAAKETILQNQQDIAQGQVQTDTKIQKSTQSAFAKMTQAANLYGIAYQAMSNDNMSATQKFGMIAVQAAGNAAITALTTNLSQTTGQVAAETPSVLSKLWSQLGWGAIPVFAIFTGLLGGLMGLAASKIAKSKSEIAQATGVSSVASGRLTTGMLTYAEGNVNEFTDPSTLREGRQYNVDAADGKTYRARYMGRSPKTHLTNGPEFHLSGERGREMIIDAGTTRQITMNEGEIWHAIQTLSGGGRISALRRRGRGVAAFADGNLSEFPDYSEYPESAAAGMSAEQAASLQASIDRQSDLLEDLRINGIKATFDVYGKGGLVDSYDSGKKTLNRYGQRY